MYKVYFIGDLHQDLRPVRDFYTYMNSHYDRTKILDETDTLVVLGDFGANFFFDKRDEDFKKNLGRYKVQYFIIRGNHEERPSILANQSPADWEKQTYFGNEVWVEKKFPYIKYAMDFPTIYSIDHCSTLVIPGAYSVDKYYRLQNNKGWFPHEQLSEEEMDFGRKITNVVDNYFLVLSHTCPIGLEPTDLFLSVIDQNMVDKTMERYLGEIEMKIKYQLWLWGHYHKTRVYPEHDGMNNIMMANDSVLDLTVFKKTKNPYDALVGIHRLKG